MKSHKKCILLSLLSLLLATTSVIAQEEDGPVPLPPLLGGEQESDATKLQKEMLELFIQVEKNLIKIDEQLADAGAGDVNLEEVQDAGLEDLLRSVQDKGNETKSQIDRILEIAGQLDQKGGGGSGGGKSDKPSPGNDSQGPQQEENTPEAKKPGEEKPKDQADGDPKGGQEQKEDQPETQQGGAPKDGAQNRATHSDDADRWGFLPDRQRKTFRNQGRDDLPVQYRQWIDTYYRRLNKDSN